MSKIMDPEHHFATTLGPENPIERLRYQRWISFSKKMGLPVTFEIGKKSDLSFWELLQQASVIVTTSVAEGFGLAFLEPWLAKRSVCGRDLPEITAEFRQYGFKLPWLYNRLNVPVGWLSLEKITEKAELGLKKSLAAYGRSPSAKDLQRLLDGWIKEEMVDYGRLNEGMQEIVLHRVCDSAAEASAIELDVLLDSYGDAQIVEDNHGLLKKHYSLQEYGKTIMRCYQHIAGSEVTSVGALEGSVLLDHFLAPERLSLLRVD